MCIAKVQDAELQRSAMYWKRYEKYCQVEISIIVIKPFTLFFNDSINIVVSFITRLIMKENFKFLAVLWDTL